MNCCEVLDLPYNVSNLYCEGSEECRIRPKERSFGLKRKYQKARKDSIGASIALEKSKRMELWMLINLSRCITRFENPRIFWSAMDAKEPGIDAVQPTLESEMPSGVIRARKPIYSNSLFFNPIYEQNNFLQNEINIKN
ncbi:hypothetical protein B9Z55_022883 [Caenorhabditis nigoni]|nr:hypothetical protein B9Z55_022883 [Caenorhabditis nigoni]